MVKEKLKVSGMHCPSCEILIKDILADEDVVVITISSKSGNLEISFDESKISLEKIKSLLSEEGYKTNE